MASKQITVNVPEFDDLCAQGEAVIIHGLSSEGAGYRCEIGSQGIRFHVPGNSHVLVEGNGQCFQNREDIIAVLKCLRFKVEPQT